VPEQDERMTRIAREIFILSFLGIESSQREGGGELVSALVSQMQDVFLAAGEVLYREGEPSEHFFFVMSGELRTTREGPTFGVRSILGAIDSSLGRPHALTATAVTDSHLLRLRAEVWFDLLEDNFEISRNGIRNLARDLHALIVEVSSHGQPADSPRVEPGPPPPPEPMNLVDRILVLRRTEPFRWAHMQAITRLAEAAEETRFAPGDEVFEGADAVGAYYVVAAGEVQATRAGSEPMSARFGAFTLVCAAASMAGELGLYSARATAPTIVMRLRTEDIFEVMEEHFDLVRATFMMLSGERERLLEKRVRRGPTPGPSPRDGAGLQSEG
jgi:CRP-like cAMP-binding protein